jgi:hypothetical protein
MKQFFTSLILLLVAITTYSQVRYLKGILQSSQEVPANTTTASGVVIVQYNTSTKLLKLVGNYKGLVSAATVSHIHGPAAPGTNAAVLFPLANTGDTTGVLSGTVTLTAAQETDLLNGLMYVNVHNATYPDGQIRAQLTTTTDGQTDYFSGRLQGAQQVPPNGSAGTGSVQALLDKARDSVYLTGNFSGLTAAASAAHIHNAGAPGVNGPVFQNLVFSNMVSGTLHVAAPISAANEAEMINGTTYVNIHNAPYPGGEIRAQLSVNAGESEYLVGNLQPSQEVPPTSSSASGSVTTLLDRANSRVYVTGSFTGLTAAATAGHIHEGPTGISGPVIVPLNVTAATSGTITGSGTVSAGFMDSLTRGYTYVNIHNATNPGGEIRAQLGNLVLPLKLVYFNGYKAGNKVSLVWETTQEVNLRQFEIEQQDASGAWIRKATIAAVNGSATNKYSYADVPTTGKNEYVLYRLKMVDADGKYTYSPVVRINFNQLKASLTIATNPVVNGSLVFTISGLAGNQKAAVMVADYTGRIVLRSVVSTLQNNRVDVSRLGAGLYRLVIDVNGTTLQESFTK